LKAAELRDRHDGSSFDSGRIGSMRQIVATISLANAGQVLPGNPPPEKVAVASAMGHERMPVLRTLRFRLPCDNPNPSKFNTGQDSNL
jgi:hypothetical protein